MMRPARKTKSSIPDLPRPESGMSQRSTQSGIGSQKNSSRGSVVQKGSLKKSVSSQQNLVDKLDDAFKDLDTESDHVSVYSQSANRFYDDLGENDSSYDNFSQLSKQSHKRMQKSELPPITNGFDTLARAKNLLSKNKSEIPKLKEKQKSLLKFQPSDDGAFLTGVNVYREEEPESPPLQEYEEEVQEPPQFNEEEVILDLIREQKKQTDYSDIWKLINDTKKEVCEYAEELYDLKNLTSETNQELNKGGRGVHQQRFWDIDCGLETQMPGGDSRYIFNQKADRPLVKSKKSLPDVKTHKKSSTSLNANKPKSMNSMYGGLKQTISQNKTSLYSSKKKSDLYNEY